MYHLKSQMGKKKDDYIGLLTRFNQICHDTNIYASTDIYASILIFNIYFQYFFQCLFSINIYASM